MHYRKGLPLGERFAQDVAVCLELPGVGFEAVPDESRRADRVGNLLIDGNTYAAGSPFHGRLLTVGLGYETVQILDEHSAPVRMFPRVFGKQTETIFEPASLVPLTAVAGDQARCVTGWTRRRPRTGVGCSMRLMPRPGPSGSTMRFRPRHADPTRGRTGQGHAGHARPRPGRRHRTAGGTEPPAANADSSVFDTFTTLNMTTGEVA